MMIMQAISCTPDVMGMYPKKDDIPELESIDMEYDERFLCTIEDECGGTIDEEADWDNHMSDLKTALLLVRWISEMSEDALTEVMKIGPGDIRARVDSMEWLTYAMIEIAVLFRPEAVKRLRRLLTRIKYGVREELIELVSLRGVGRARARTLYDNGIKTKKDIAEADFFAIANLPRIGNALAKSLKLQTDSFTGIPERPPEPQKTQTSGDDPDGNPGGQKKKIRGQSTLFDF